MLEILFGLVLAVLLVLIFQDLSRQSRMKKLTAQIPGPRKVPLIGCFGLPNSGKEKLSFRKKMIAKYGPIHKYWFGSKLDIVLTDPKDAEAILNSMNTLAKGSAYDYLIPWLGTGLLTSTGVKWQLRRKAITPTFHFKILEEFIDVFNKKARKLLQKAEEKVEEGIFDILPYISNYTLDVICETAMGVEVNAQENADSAYIKAVNSMLNMVAALRTKPWIVNKFVLRYMEKEKQQLLTILHRFTNSIIQSKKLERMSPKISSNPDSGSRNKIAFLELLINMSETPNSPIKTDEDIREEVDTFMFEGHDTTASSLGSTLFLLAKHQDIQAKVLNEATAFISSSDYDLTYKDLQAMKYIEMVIKESLRLYPSVPGISRCLTNDVTLSSGCILPAGCYVNIDIYHIHRNPKYFPNPEQFNPDNFLQENTIRRNSYAFIPFSAGPRNCIGQKFAMLEMKATVAKFVYKYKLDIEGPGSDIDPTLGPIFKPANGYKVKISLRS